MKSIGVSATFIAVFLLGPLFASAITIEVSATVPGCGDGTVASGEACDGTDMNGASCSSLGFNGGSLSCTNSCTFDTLACTTSIGTSGGGGSGNDDPPIIPATNVVFTGKAYPKQTVILLKDAQTAATTVADANANFQIALSNLSAGNYIFSIYAEDQKGVRSSSLTFPVRVTSNVTTKVGHVFVAPTISVDKTAVRRGDSVAISGQTAPSSEVIVSVQSGKEVILKKRADSSGAYLVNFDTATLAVGEYQTKSKTVVGGEVTPYSKTMTFNVGLGAADPIAGPAKGDFNGDKRVNLVDFSVAAYWYKRSNAPASSDLNTDGTIDLIDFSIMAFNWTG